MKLQTEKGEITISSEVFTHITGAAASDTVLGCFLRSSAAAVEMVRLILVPVSPSGTGKTLSSLICCFCRLMEAAAWMIA